MNSLKLGLLSVALLGCFGNFARAAVFRTELEPVIGYERVQKVVPTPHSRDQLLYGARLTAGVLWVAAEIEYLNSSDSESFPLEAATTKDVTDRVKAGVRVSMNLARFIAFTLRGGAQAKKTRHTETIAGVSSASVTPITYKPYLGAGLTATLARNIAFRADVTTVFADFPSFAGAEYQATAGFIVRFP